LLLGEVRQKERAEARNAQKKNKNPKRRKKLLMREK
jgi:hypothetical protein